MIIKSGDIWEWNSEKRWIVITTNIGWKKDGSNPMGAGIAKTASNQYPSLAKWYGGRYKKYGERTAVAPFQEGRLFMFPTKPLNEDQPWMSWQSDACISLISRSCHQLVKLADVLTERGHFFPRIGLTSPGCGRGNLTKKQVIPVIADILDDRFVLLD